MPYRICHTPTMGFFNCNGIGFEETEKEKKIPSEELRKRKGYTTLLCSTVAMSYMNLLQSSVSSMTCLSGIKTNFKVNVNVTDYITV